MLLYKLGDSMATALQSTFVLKMGFSKTDLGTINKGVGLISSIVGGIVAGIWMLRLGINKALWVFGVVQALAILAFVALAHYGPFAQIGGFERTLLAVVIAAETFGMSLGTMAFVAFIARTTNPSYTALQLALFTSLTAVPRSFINASTGWLVERMGWESFFYLCMLLAIPGMLMLFKIAPWHEEHRVN
jgi:PAT family beta-lactamase induction signal transducer AmpG